MSQYLIGYNPSHVYSSCESRVRISHALLRGKVAPESDKATGESNAFKILQESSELDHFEKENNSMEHVFNVNTPLPGGKRKYNWKEIAQMLDKCCMYTYIILFVIATTVCLGVLGSAYNST